MGELTDELIIYLWISATTTEILKQSRTMKKLSLLIITVTALVLNGCKQQA